MSSLTRFNNFPIPRIFHIPSSTIYLLTLLFLPQQFGPHFWPDFSYVHGIRLDYLSPSIYVSDVLIILLFITSAKKVFSSTLSRSFFSSSVFLLFLLSIIIPLTYASSPSALLFGILKLFELLFLGLYTATQLNKKDITPICLVFLFIGVFESILSIFQYINQGSLNGVFYFFGERFYNGSSIGIANMQTAQGLSVRPYGTFPHPNVLSFYLFTSFVFGAFMLYQVKTARKKLIVGLLLLVIQVGIFLSFSRIVLFCDLLFAIYFLFRISTVKNLRTVNAIPFIAIILCLVFYIFSNSYRLINTHEIISALVPRLELTQISLKIIEKFSFFGTGLNNYFYSEIQFQKNFSDIYLQPVHNIYLYACTQIGLMGSLLFLYFTSLTLQRVVRMIRSQTEKFSFQKAVFVILISILFIGFFDHFFLTIQQGQLLLALVLALSWNKKVYT